MPRCSNPRCQIDYPVGTIQCTNPFCQCLLPEALIAGRYRVETLVGIGGMGAVYRASDMFEMNQIALKVLTLINNSLMDYETAAERFRREARYSRQLQHKNIVPVLNFGQDGQYLYLTMPLITGGTLKSLLKDERPLPIVQAQRFLENIADAVDAIHNHPQQIVHRDIKPSNLLIHQDDGRLVVTDFGIARAMQQEKSLTMRGWSLGTEHYIAPEQERGHPQPGSDIYAMGVVAYQMFTGLLPFQAVVKNRASELPPPSTLNIALPPTIDTVILRAIDIDPARRHTSGRMFADAINTALMGDSIWSAPTIIASSAKNATSSANIIVRALIPENPCARCGRENRTTSHFCRHCGHSLNDTSPLVTDNCQVGYASDIGLRARENEDMLLIVQGLCVTLTPPRSFGLFAVSDGLLDPQGKSAGGHEASKLAIEALSDVLLPLLAHNVTQPDASGPPRLPRQALYSRPLTIEKDILAIWLSDAMRQANQVLHHCNRDYETTMASTLTAALLYKRRLLVASIGDSRAYHYSVSEGLQRLTTDHTIPGNELPLTISQLHPDDAYKSTRRDRHYRYLGQHYYTSIDIFQKPTVPDDLILLCTDGLWHMLSDTRIQEILDQGGDTQKLANQLIDEANNAGGHGNISVIVLRVH